MKEKLFEFHASDVVKLSLEDFEGPIQLLYQLIVVDGRYDIRTFPLALITDQYMAYMKQADRLDMDVASDFLSVAATLLEIKSRYVIPVRDEDEADEQPEEFESEEELRLRLMIYGLFKEKGEKLSQRETRYKFCRAPVFSMRDALYVIPRFDFGKLIDAYGQVLLRINERELDLATKRIAKDPFTVSQKITFLAQKIVSEPKLSFRSLFRERATRSEIITTFQALLELMKKQVIRATQQGFGDDIIMELNEEFDPAGADWEALSVEEAEENAQ